MVEGKTMRIQPYINFNGNCQEAVEFYCRVFNLEKPQIMFIPNMPNLVMHTNINIKGNILMFSDAMPQNPVNVGNNITLTIVSDDMDEIKEYFSKLAIGGTVIMELQQTFWSKYYGYLKDKYGIMWQLSHESSQTEEQEQKQEKVKITVETTVAVPVETAWEYWTTPKHIVNWNNASDDWGTSFAENILEVGGEFCYTMEANDGSFGFDFSGIYTEVVQYEKIAYNLGDVRKVTVDFIKEGSNTRIVEIFDAETQNPIEMQQKGWQAILDNYKRYVEKKEA